MKHIAYVFDSLIYFLRSCNDKQAQERDSGNAAFYGANLVEEGTSSSSSACERLEVQEDTSLESMPIPVPGKRHSFFKRSESTLCLGCAEPEPFEVCWKFICAI
jgi:E3 ubiquitin-protein ligase EDD1